MAKRRVTKAVKKPAAKPKTKSVSRGKPRVRRKPSYAELEKQIKVLKRRKREPYAKRIERLMALGLSRSAARGHARPTEITASEIRLVKIAAKANKGDPIRARVNAILIERGISSVEKMADFFVMIGLTRHEAYTLAFSP